MPSEGKFVLIKTTLLDFPGRVAAAVYFPGCHLRCPYCHNPELVRRDGISDFLNGDIRLFKEFVRRREKLINAIVFSGGEALLHPLLNEMIDVAKGAGWAVKVDTAGLLPEKLEILIKTRVLDFAAVDLKTLPARYGEIGWTGQGDPDELIRQTIDVLNRGKIDFEVRTTVVPGLVDEEILRQLSVITQNVPRWIWQPYRRAETLDPDWGMLQEPEPETLAAWARTNPCRDRIQIR